MQTKLTLRLDEALIEKAKAWAKSRGISVSEAVAGFFSQLPDEEPEPELSPWLQSLAGIGARSDGTWPTDEEVRDEYGTYLEKKYS